MASRILLADDSITIQKVVNLTFADEGIEVVAVSNGEMAERRLNEINPDLVLADIFMPGKNGYELCQFIKDSAHFRHVPVVLLVGAFEPFDQAEARRVRADAHLTKPFESRTLVETVRKLIETSRPPAPVRFAPSAVVEQQEPQPAAPSEPGADFPLMNLDFAAPPEQWEASDTQVETQVHGDLDTPLAVEAEQLETGLSAEPFSIAYTTPEMTAEQPAVESRIEEAQAGLETSGFAVGEFEALPEQTEPEPIEVGEGSGFSVPSLFGTLSPDTVLDFDRVDSPGAPDPSNGLSFEIDAAEMAPVDDGFGAPAGHVNELGAPEPEVGFDLHSTTGFEINFQPVDASVPDEPVLAQGDREAELASQSFSFYEVPAETPSAASFETLAQPESETVSVPEEDAKVEEATAIAQEPSAEEITPEPPPPSAVVAEAQEMTLIDEALGSQEETWRSEQAQFAPLDLEEVPELTSPDVSIEETGFEVAEVIADESGFALVQHVTPEHAALDEAAPFLDLSAVTAERLAASVSAGESKEESIQTLAPTLDVQPELPQAVIDEIVRRVVSQLTDTVVREVAWEVVPDCVERVVEKMTRDSAARKL